MRLIGMLMARNEQHEIGLSLSVLLKFCDAVVVLLHACTDRTIEIVQEISRQPGNTGKITLTWEEDPTWNEMPLRQRMLETARELGATHLWMSDADEILTANSTEPIAIEILRAALERIAKPGQMVFMPLYNLRNGTQQYHANGVWGSRIVSVAFPDEPRLSWTGDRFHSREPGGLKMPPWDMSKSLRGHGGIMHLWGANERRLIAKHAAYKLIERLRWPSKSVTEIDAMYSLSVKGCPCTTKPSCPYLPRDQWTYRDVPAMWWDGYRDLVDRYLHLDGEIWQESEVASILEKYGRDRFVGLDLFGL